MHLYRKIFAVLLALAFMGSYSLAFAQVPGGANSAPQGSWYGRPSSQNQGGPGSGTGSSSWQGGPGHGPNPGPWTGSSTWPTPPPSRIGSSTGDLHLPLRLPTPAGITGVITELDSGSFLIATRNLETNSNATTTLTIDVSDSTTYREGSTTASFADLVVGDHVLVVGSIATSTKTITAKSVLVVSGMPSGPGGILGKIMSIFGKPGATASGTPNRGDGAGFFQGFLNFFGGGQHGEGQGNNSGGPAAAGDTSFTIGDVWNTFLGWFH